jgi:ABC-type branched-subunit amino acid transport system ATPase component
VVGGLIAGLAASGGLIAYLLRNFSTINEWLPLISGVFVILTVLYVPGGIAEMYGVMIRSASSRFAARFTRTDAKPEPDRREPDPHSVTASEPEVTGAGMSKNDGRASDPHDDGLHSSGENGLNGKKRNEVLLALRGITVEYGSVRALDDIDLEVRRGQIVGVIGPNGAGKTTLIDAISGFCPTRHGAIEFDANAVTNWSIHRRARAGMSRTFQNLELFLDLSARENMLAADDRRDLLAYITNLVMPGSRALPPLASELISMFGLDDVLDRKVRDLPQGTQRLVAICRAVAAKPALLCLDEPTAGLNGAERAAVCSVIKLVLQRLDIGILLVEHNIDVVADLCHDLVVFEFGRILAKGDAHDVLRRSDVRTAYLGSASTERESGPLSVATATSTKR